MAAYANGMRDLLSVLDVDRVTLIGHSLGGGVVMQFAYQYLERTERLVLIGAGGGARAVTPALRAASLPGAELALSLLGRPGLRRPSVHAVRALHRIDPALGRDAGDLVRLVDARHDATSAPRSCAASCPRRRRRTGTPSSGGGCCVGGP